MTKSAARRTRSGGRAALDVFCLNPGHEFPNPAPTGSPDGQNLPPTNLNLAPMGAAVGFAIYNDRFVRKAAICATRG